MNGRTEVRSRGSVEKKNDDYSSNKDILFHTNGLKKKGKHASSTQNRRMVWEGVVWPLILEVNRSYFTLDEYHSKRDSFCLINDIPQPKSCRRVRVFISERNSYKGKENLFYSLSTYSIMRKRVHLEYGQVMREISTKR